MSQTRALSCTHAQVGTGKFLYIIAQYPVLWNAKARYTLLPWQTCSITTQQLMREDC